MNLQSNWRDQAICFHDKNAHKWTSYNYDDVQYAKDGCSICPVRKQCLVTAMTSNSFVGVIAGISEFDFLMYTWEEVNDINESNWGTGDTAFSRLLQKIQ